MFVFVFVFLFGKVGEWRACSLLVGLLTTCLLHGYVLTVSRLACSWSSTSTVAPCSLPTAQNTPGASSLMHEERRGRNRVSSNKGTVLSLS